MKYSIGLDIGISSVGWSVINLDKKRIEKMGARLYDAAENPKNGSSLAAPRRDARSARRRLRRRRYRVGKVRQFILEKGLLTRGQMEQLYDWKAGDLDIWLVRVNALERLLTDREFARVLVHLAKNRGYRSNRKSESKKDDNGQVLSAIKANKELMKEKGYQTVAEMLVSEPEKFAGRKRNRDGEYTHVLARGELEQEIQLIFEKQHEYGQRFATPDNKKIYIEIWSAQRPVATKEDILKKIGDCTFEKGEKRAPKASYAFQYFRALDKLSRLRILSSSQPSRELAEEERNAIIPYLFDKEKVTYFELRKKLSLAEDQRFNDLFYDPAEDLKKNENKVFLSLKEQYEIRKIIKNVEGKDALVQYRPVDLDEIAYALTIFKDDKDTVDYLSNNYVNEKGKRINNRANRKYNKELIDNLLSLSFSKFGHLSLKALNKLIPLMEKGIPYFRACDELGYRLDEQVGESKQHLLPVIPADEIRNPVVIRSLSQTRKIINGIIKRYGSPLYMYIELAREMGRPYKERRDLDKQYNKNRAVNDDAKAYIQELYPHKNPQGHDILKFKLWQQQDCKCAYSQETIHLNDLFESGFTEVDHIIPYSRSFDDSNTNKVLVLSKMNQEKKNRTPSEWFGADEHRWKKFESYVKTLKVAKKKKDLLLKRNMDDEQEQTFKARHLNDTRYITRFIKSFVEDNLEFREVKDAKQHVFAVNGAYTSLMRKRWGFNKNREANDLHHAVDAVIIAVSQPFRYEVSTYFKHREVSLKQLLKRTWDRFPEPWEEFVKELRARILQEPERLKLALDSLALDSYDQEFISEVKPIFISRMPKRSVKGQIHEETLRRVRGTRKDGYARIVTRTKLENIPFDKKTGDFPMFGKESDMKTYQAIKQRYLESGKDKNKAFIEPLYKPAKDMNKASIIRSVKIEDKANQVVSLKDEAVAANASIVRTEVYQHKKTGKFYLVPVYVADVVAGREPKKFIKPLQPYEKWVDITDDYKFLFNLFSNDVVYVKMKKSKTTKSNLGETIMWQEGYFYYKKTDSATAQIGIMDHMNSYVDRIGSQNLQIFEKYQIDPLGHLTKVHGEKKYGIPALSHS
ncbi:type II CRISPR RNA-guided endonuclease Cas9 [Sporolactobacillus nakayamae]|uniref:CRISPR-associated endonuclease Cas9 n=1 Tax=Sporolactobacillus nakayamae TaxID=269670 RepID=A0A1I2QS29_9BACL|nr:type II CRISPR RNA-guided endonuclease Cas9 [Sporolactobacillus nakayamae]SFG31232.1 CRISPR-associated endonuclease Csn1 [Sporolactobacillus nakayamae]